MCPQMIPWFAGLLLFASVFAADARSELPEQAAEGLAQAIHYFRSEVATEGGYLWWYSEDLSHREGEGRATETQIWVQPPGTPEVGFAYLRAYQANPGYIEAVREVADALIWGQLESGGWDYKIDFAPEANQRWRYRHHGNKERGRNQSTFDDNTTQSALRYLIAVAEITNDLSYHEAAKYGLEMMLRAQFENGAWPQRYPLSSKGYSRMFTFNDNSMNDCIKVMMDAFSLYQDPRYFESVRKAGDFIIRSQGKGSQRAWAQQYNDELRPVWARKFEPPSYCSAVTSRNIRTLIDIYEFTGDRAYLDPIPTAIEWLQGSEIAPNRWARFYEIDTNRPLYFTREYELVYTDDDLPTHYSFQGSYGVSGSIKRYETAKSTPHVERTQKAMTPAARQARLAQLEPAVRDTLSNLDERGRWVEDGKLQVRTFNRNISLLAEYLELVRKN